jgi:hypothetical protein
MFQEREEGPANFRGEREVLSKLDLPEDRIGSNRAKEIISDFFARSWPGWLSMSLAATWVGLGGGHLFSTEHFTHVGGTLAVGALVSAGRTIWQMARAGDEYEYEEIGAGGFVAFSSLLSVWTVIASPPAR